MASPNSLTDMLASLHQQQNIINEAVPLLERLAELRGENPLHTIPLHRNGKRRSMRRKKARRVTGRPKRVASTKRQAKRTPKVAGEGRTGDYALAIVKAARKPIGIAEITARAQAAGWTSSSPKPESVIGQALYVLKKEKKLKKFGTSGSYTWGLPEWKAAADVAASMS